MSKKKTAKEIEVRIDEKEEKVMPTLSAAKKARKALLEAYKIQNPAKFEHKGFDKELKNL